MNCTSCNHEVHTNHCTVQECECGVCSWPGVGYGLREIVEDIAVQVNRALPMAEDVRQLRESIDALARDIQALTKAVASLARDVAALRTELQRHVGDTALHVVNGE